MRQIKNRYVFRCWTRDKPQDGRVYLDIWDVEGAAINQQLVQKGTEDAIFELVESHMKQYPEQYRNDVGGEGE